MSESFATRVYVVGEVLISLAALVGGFSLVFFSQDEAVKLVGSGAVSAVTVAWFSRRQAEQSNNSLKGVADGALREVQEQQLAQRASIEALLQTIMRERQRSG